MLTQGSFDGSHVYADNGIYTVTVIASDDDAGSDTETFQVTVDNLAPIVGNLAVNTPISENATATVSGTFTDIGLVDTHSVAVNWADPNNSAASTFAVAPTGTLTVGQTFNSTTDSAVLTVTAVNTATGAVNFSIASHQYLDDGVSAGTGTASDGSTIVVTVADDDGGAGTGSVGLTVNNVAPAVSNVAVNTPINENGSATVTGTFTDIGMSDVHTVTVAWDDPNDAVASTFIMAATKNLSLGQTFTSADGAVLTVAAVNATTGAVDFSVASHQYLDDGVSGNNNWTATDGSTITVTVADDDGGSGTGSVGLSVNNVGPTVTSVAVNSPITENGTATVTGTFTDIGMSDTHAVTAVWGDTNNATASTFAVSATRALHVNDTFASTTDSAVLTVTSINAATGAVGFSIASHRYLDDGLAPGNGTSSDVSTITVTVTDDDGQSASAGTTLTVINAAPVVVIAGSPGTSAEGTAINLGRNLIDPGSLDTFDYLWHVAASNGQVIADGTTSSFSFTPDDAGIYTVSLTVTDDDGGVGTDSNTITVTEVAPTVALTGNASTAEAAVYTLTIGDYTDPGSLGGDAPDTYFIHWGDSTADTVITEAALNAAGRHVTHTYADGTVPPGSTTPTSVISVDILESVDYWSDQGMDGAQHGKGVVVYNVAATATTLGGSSTVNEGSTGTVTFVGQTDVSSADRAAGYTYSYDFTNDGIFEVSGSLLSSVTVPASVLNDGAKDVTVRGRIMDKDGGYTDYTKVIHVNNVKPTVNFLSNGTVGAGNLYTQSGTFTDPGADATWTGTVNYGDGTILPLTINQIAKSFTLSHVYSSTAGSPYTVTVTITDKDSATSDPRTCQVTVVPTTFQVASFTPTVSGFDVTFNRAFNASELNLYEGFNFGLGASDVTLMDTTTGIPVQGSLVLDADGKTAHFVQTGGVLIPNHTYAATLFSTHTDGSAGWRDTGGGLLDGDANGTAGDSYSSASFVAPATAGDRILSIPDFARGPAQTVKVNNGSYYGTAREASGLPVSISDGSGVTSVHFVMTYNPALLDITDVNLASGLPGGWAVEWNTPTSGQLYVTAWGTTAMSSGPHNVVDIMATVPTEDATNGLYGASELLNLTNIIIGPGTIAARGDAAVHKAAYFCDVDFDGYVAGADASLIARNTVVFDDGFSRAPLTDPLILANASPGYGFLTGADASLVAQKSVGFTVPEIPDEGPDFPVIASIDPTVQIGNTNTVANPGQTVATPVRITDDTQGATSITMNVSYDSTLLDLSNADVGLSAYLTSLGGWSLVSNVVDANGTARVVAYGVNPLPSGAADLVNLSFHVPANATAGTSPLHFASCVLGPTGLITTPVDGSITVAAPPRVQGVYVGSTAWKPSFTGLLAGQGLGNELGYAVPAGADELKSLPWTNLDKVSVKFSADVNVQQSDLALAGSAVPSYAIKSFSYDASSHVATWTLNSPIPADKVLVALHDTITDKASGYKLDGDWASGSSSQAFPSGNNDAGGNFLFRFNVVPGDVSRDTVVNNSDQVKVRNAGGLSVGDLGYTAYLDVDGNGAINNADTVKVRNAGGSELPAFEPVVPLFAPVMQGAVVSNAGLGMSVAAPVAKGAAAGGAALIAVSDVFLLENGGLNASKPTDLLDSVLPLALDLKLI